jgi:hypothetical protein
MLVVEFFGASQHGGARLIEWAARFGPSECNNHRFQPFDIIEQGLYRARINVFHVALASPT